MVHYIININVNSSFNLCASRLIYIFVSKESIHPSPLWVCIVFSFSVILREQA
jgi:hypothetical protein